MSIATSFPLYVLTRLQDPAPDADAQKLHLSLTRDLLKLQENIRKGLASTEAVPFPAMAATHVELLFSTRIRSFKWFAQHQAQLDQLYDVADQAPSHPDAPASETLGQLHSNVQFALWVARRTFAGISSQTTVRMTYLEQVLSRLDPESLSFGLYLALLAPSIKPQTFLHGYFHFLRQGLLLEYGLLAASEILSNPHACGQTRMDELAGFISNIAQETGIYALQLGIGNELSESVTDGFQLLSDEKIQQAHRLAERDFKAWLKSREQ